MRGRSARLTSPPAPGRGRMRRGPPRWSRRESMYRVIQWTTGNVGRRAVRAIVEHPELELVGLYAHGADKVGHDAGELCGLPRLGVRATRDVDELLALRADCVNYNGLLPDVDAIERFLAAGTSVVTTAGMVTGKNLGVRERL